MENQTITSDAALGAPIDDKGLDPLAGLNSEQRQVAESILRTKRNAVIVTGPAGTGKSFLMRALQRATGATTCAMTGTAAINIDGCTFHSLFSFNSDDISLPRNQNVLLRNIEGLEWVIVDEVSMMTADTWRYVKNWVIRYNKHIKFILVGDFNQLPPVVKNKTQSGNIRTQDSNELLIQHEDFCTRYGEEHEDGPNIYDLKVSCRQSDLAFFAELSNLRKGVFTQEFLNMLVPCAKVFDLERAGSLTCLFATNNSVANHNAEMTDRLCTIDERARETLHVIRARYIPSTLKGAPEYRYPINELLADSPVGHEVYLCINQRVVLTRNGQGLTYSNGDTGTIVDIEHVLGHAVYQVMLDRNGMVVPIGRTDIEVKVNGSQVCGVVRGYPIRPGYALTVHKAQGQSLDRVRVNMRSMSSMYSTSRHGLLYVALSRARSLSGLEVDIIDPSLCSVDPRLGTVLWWNAL